MASSTFSVVSLINIILSRYRSCNFQNFFLTAPTKFQESVPEGIVCEGNPRNAVKIKSLYTKEEDARTFYYNNFLECWTYRSQLQTFCLMTGVPDKTNIFTLIIALLRV